MIIYFGWRLRYLCKTVPPDTSRRTLKKCYRLAKVIFGITFIILYAILFIAYLLFEKHCEGTDIENGLKTIRTIAGLHCLFMVGSMIYVFTRIFCKSSKRNKDGQYESSDEADDREFEE